MQLKIIFINSSFVRKIISAAFLSRFLFLFRFLFRSRWRPIRFFPWKFIGFSFSAAATLERRNETEKKKFPAVSTFSNSVLCWAEWQLKWSSKCPGLSSNPASSYSTFPCWAICNIFFQSEIQQVMARMSVAPLIFLDPKFALKKSKAWIRTGIPSDLLLETLQLVPRNF